jgi:hypothetical protein
MSYELTDDIAEGMSSCCSAAVDDPSGENIEGVCMDCKEHCTIIPEDCQHDEIHAETDEDFDGRAFSYYVCDICGEDVAGDPTADAYDAMIDMQIDEARGK